MVFSHEQQKAYYEANKARLNQQRAERRKLKRLGQVETPNQVNQVETLPEVETVKEMSQPKKEVETLKEPKWSFEIFLEKQGYTNPNNPVYFSPEKIKEMKNNSLNYWKEKNPNYYENIRTIETTTPN